MEYICTECGGVFDHPLRKKLGADGWEGLGWRGEYCSPCCGQGFDAVHRCDLCGTAVREGGVGALCALCAEDAAGRLKNFVRNNYTRLEQEALDILTEGISFTRLGGDEKEEKACQIKSDGGN